MILVDSSVLIDYLKGTENSKSLLFQEILNKEIPFGITNLIFMEILQGSRTEKEFNLLKKYLITLPFYSLVDEKDSNERASLLNLLCKKSGITVRSTIDLIITETAIENDLSLLHNDKDFDNIASVISDLRILKISDLT